MSHNIKYYKYKENVNRNKVQADLDRYVAYEDRKEGCSGLNSPIRWIESCGVLDNYDMALEYIRNHDKGWYDSLAVRFRESNGIESSALKKAREKLNIASDKYLTLTEKFHFENIKATLIGCQNCGSKISRQHLKGNHCPVCRNDLRPQSTQDTLARYKENFLKARALVEAEEKKSIAKNSKVMWLVKIEYHT